MRQVALVVQSDFVAFKGSRLLRSGSKATSSRSKVQGCFAVVQSDFVAFKKQWK